MVSGSIGHITISTTCWK